MVFARRDGLSCLRDLPCFSVGFPSLRAVTHTPGRGLGTFSRYSLPQSHGLPQRGSGSAPPSAPTSASVGSVFRRCSVRFMLRPAELLALLCRTDPELPPADEGFYTQAFPRSSHPPLELSMTTRHPRVDTMAGLAPAGTLPLQAALFPRPCLIPYHLRQMAFWH